MDDLMELVVKDTIITGWRWLSDRPAKYKVIYFPVKAYTIDDAGKKYIATHIIIRIYMSHTEMTHKNKFSLNIYKDKIENAYMSICKILEQAINDEKILLFQWLDK